MEEYLNHVNKGDDGNDSPSKRSDDPPLQMGDFTFESGPPGQDSEAPGTTGHSQDSFDLPNFTSHEGSNFMGDGQLMGLGYSETVPPFEVQEELYDSSVLFHYDHRSSEVTETTTSFSSNTTSSR